MYTSTISTKYQVVIPSEVRKEFNIKPGQISPLFPTKRLYI
jgi:bifunctional DNA-binding transcriptional regulator/antitoxin component of YhaV-PrlF toxin-antitoxin module